jgi:PAS domain S-box-containing protein
MRDKCGKPQSIITVIRDITERKRAEQALRESEEMSRSVLDNATMGVYLLQDKKFLYVNPTFAKIIGYTSEELVGRDAINYVHPDDRSIIRIKAVENLKGISNLPYEFRILRKDGRQIWVMERVASIQYQGRRAVIASFMETTEHRKAQVELEHAYEELKKAHERMVQTEKIRAMGEMASGIAHDFNNMLAVILGRAELIMDDVKDDKVKRGLQIIEQAALDAAKTVKRIQESARNRVDVAFERLDVNQVVEDVLTMVETRVTELEQTKRITIKVAQELAKVGMISGDAAELREALLNILFNALDAMPMGGKLTVKIWQDEDSVQISITDTGVGIPDKIKNKISESFFTTKASKGSGLGLSVTYSIIARHGGMIKFDSVEGQGTTFYIRLPLAVEAAKKETQKGKAVSAKAANILVVDDEPEVLKALGLNLEYFGHWVRGFTSGAEAIKAFKDGNYDLVITDLGMPEVSGWDVTHAIKEIQPDMPVLLITGWSIELDEEQKKIVDGVIAKPFSRDSISSAIDQVLPTRKGVPGKRGNGSRGVVHIVS